MAGRIRDEDVALVRERSPIADVVGEYLDLRNAGGGNLKGLCPFHDENSPSFNVTPSRGLYHCFGCQAGGDVISFVRNIEHLSFVEAVEHLAQRAGVQLRYEQGRSSSVRVEHGERQRLLEAHRAAAEFFAEQLLTPQAGAARTLLAERGFTRADAERFGVGFAPPGWESLTRHLRKRGFTDAELVLGGLASQGRRGAYDKFRNRLVWPVREVTGDVVGFGARKLDPEDDGPKYLNTPETPIFKKSTLLYGIDLAKRDISRQRQAVVVEGYTDVMACHLAGVATAVATCGTSFGSDHVKVLRRLLEGRTGHGGSVVFTFDGDAAGQKAALRAFDEAQGQFTHLYVAVQPDGLDPCDLRGEQGDAAVRALVEARKPLVDFVIRSRVDEFDLDSTEGQLAAIDSVVPAIAGIRDSGQREMTTRNLARWVAGGDETFVKQRVAQLGRVASGGRDHPARGAAHGSTRSRPALATARDDYDLRAPSVSRERQVLKIAIQAPALAVGFDDLEPGAFTVARHRAVHELIRAQGGAAAAAAGDPARWAMSLHDAAPNDAQRDLVTQLAVERIESPGELDEHFTRELIGTVRIHAINRRITHIKARLHRLDQATEPEEYNQVFAELMTVERERRLLRDSQPGVA